MSVTELRAGLGLHRRIPGVLLGLGISILAGGLFSYIVQDITAPQYVLEIMSLIIVEAPFIALFALLTRKFGRIWCFVYCAAGTIASAALFTPSWSLTSIVFLKAALTGGIIGSRWRFGKGFFGRMTIAAAPGLTVALVFGGMILVTGVSPDIREEMRADTKEVYQTFMKDDNALNAADNAMSFYETVFKLSVAVFVLFAVVEVWWSFFLAAWLFIRFGEELEVIPPFYRFKLPFHVIWIFLAGGLVTVLDIVPVKPLAMNVLVVMSGLYGFQGLAITIFQVNRFFLGRLLKILFWVIFFLTIGFTGTFLIVLGILDNWFNLRVLPATSEG
jgi:uncharacterized protein YybS (DUF2232 family)